MCAEVAGTTSPNVSRGGRLNSTVTSVAVTGNSFPARIKTGTPAQRQLSMKSLTAMKVSTVDSLSTPGTAQ